MIKPKIFVGPMSKNIVDSVIDFANKTNIPIGLIPSRRQVEFDGGYVNNWTTKDFCEYVKSNTDNVLLVRDHAGPSQGYTDDDGIESFKVDCKYFDVIHIDVWKKHKDYNEGLKATIEFIKLGYSINPNIYYEVGTEEAIRPFTAKDIDNLIIDLKNELPEEIYSKIKYVVIQSGTALKGNTNIGEYSDTRLIEMINVVKKHGLISKEHNGDYLTNDLIKSKFENGLNSINIAPELGQIETAVVLDNLSNKSFEKFYQICYDSKRWVKWVDDDFKPEENKIDLINICGHYTFSNEEFIKLKENIDINDDVKDKIYSRIEELVKNSRRQYDYLIVGAGLYGAIFAYEMTKAGKSCLIVDKRNHIGGNCYTENRDNINVHVYGPHIFHTSNEIVWNWISKFVEFHPYKHTAKVNHNDKVYSFPINLLTLHQLWGVKTPEEAQSKIDSVKLPIENPKNMEEWMLSQVGEEIYETFIKGYTKKQWNKDPKDLPSSIVKRLPIRLNFDDNYFFDKYQGIPVGGYTEMFKKLLSSVDILLNYEYIGNENLISYKTLVFTGKIDEFFDYKYGELEYRGLKFETEKLNTPSYQGCSVINYTDINIPFTRKTEHKYFENSQSDVTWVTTEYPSDCERDDTPYYPINDEENNSRYAKYKELADSLDNVIFGGRLGEYKYYDMDKIIESALNMVDKELKNKY